MRLQIRTGSTPGWMIGGQPCRGATLGGPAEPKNASFRKRGGMSAYIRKGCSFSGGSIWLSKAVSDCKSE